MNSILVLGDSTSFSYGLERDTYVYRLDHLGGSSEPLKIYNPSIAGFTAGDAVRYFFNHLRRHGPPDIVIIYLGNCNSIAVELPKGRYTPFKSLIRDRLDFPASVRPKKRMHRLSFDAAFTLRDERPEKPSDYAYNLHRIIEKAVAVCRQVILINPVGNRRFPAGVAKGNFPFYKLCHGTARFAEILEGAPPLLQGAIAAEEAGDLDAAERRYDELLAASPPQHELAAIARNNMACLAARRGRTQQAFDMLTALLREPALLRREIIEYNVARLVATNPQLGDRAAWENAAYEHDLCLYRAREPYRAKVRELAQRFAGRLQLIDLTDVKPQDYIDHCHLAREGQRALADTIIQCCGARSPAPRPLILAAPPMNPVYGYGDSRDMFSFFTRHRAQDAIGVDPTDAATSDMLATARRHPLLEDGTLIAQTTELYGREVGRLPDLLIYRKLLPYLAYLEENQVMPELFAELGLHATEHYLALFPDDVDTAALARAPWDKVDPAPFIDTVTSAVERHIAESVRQGPIVEARSRTTLYWYLRESFRFGPTSRPTMLYDYLPLYESLEALAACAALNHRHGARRDDPIRRVGRRLAALISVHERHVSDYQGVIDDPAAAADWETAYRRSLEGILEVRTVERAYGEQGRGR